MKNSFTVGFVVDGMKIVIFGVTSIHPNMNGVLFNTENGVGYQVESHQMTDGNILGNMYIEYSDLADFEEYESFRRYTDFEIHDMRKS